MEKEKKLYAITKIAFGIIAFWIMYLIYLACWTNYMDTVADWLGVGLLAGNAVLIITAICIMFRFLFKPEVRDEFSTGYRYGMAAAVILLVGLHLYVYLFMSNTAYSVSGSMPIEDTACIDGDYYFYVMSPDNTTLVRIESTKEQNDQLIVDEEVSYGIEYRYLTVLPTRGWIESIDVENSIDNR